MAKGSMQNSRGHRQLDSLVLPVWWSARADRGLRNHRLPHGLRRGPAAQPAPGPLPLPRRGGKTFSPLAGLLTEHTAPELLYLESKFAALVSYGLTADLLQEDFGAEIRVRADFTLSRGSQAIRRETGMPRPVMMLMTLQATLASVFCVGRVRA